MSIDARKNPMNEEDQKNRRSRCASTIKLIHGKHFLILSRAGGGVCSPYDREHFTRIISLIIEDRCSYFRFRLIVVEKKTLKTEVFGATESERVLLVGHMR